VEFVASKKRHEFHENDHCDLNAIGSNTNFQSLTAGLLTQT